MRIFCASLILFFIFSSCSSDSTDSNMLSEKVKINIDGIPQILEESTEVKIVIESDLNTETTVYMNDQRINSWKDKNFTFTIDPFDYTTGGKSLKVVSIDEENNRSELSYSFQLKKLLFTLNYLFAQPSYIAIHTLDGKLVTYEKNEGQPISLYAEDDFERQNFIISSYQFNNFDGKTYILSYSGLEPGSSNLSFEEQEEEFKGLRIAGPTDKIGLRLSSNGNSLIGGFNGIVRTDNGNLNFSPLNDGEYDFLYDTDLHEDFYLFLVYEREPIFKNRYIKASINELKTNSFTEKDLLLIENFKEVPVSLGENHFFYYRVEGYRSLEDYYDYRFHLVNYDLFAQETDYKVRIPLLDDFPLYQVKFATSLEGNSSVRVDQHLSIDSDKEIRIPSMNLTKQDNSLLFNGEREYDYSILTYRKYTGNAEGDYSDFTWHFHQGFKEEIDLPLFNLQHPEEVLETMNSTTSNPFSFNPMEEGKSLYCSLNDHEDEVNFENLVFSQGYYSNEKGYKYVFEFGNLLE